MTDPLHYNCPTCGARAGDPCRWPVDAPEHSTHSARIAEAGYDAAEQAAQRLWEQDPDADPRVVVEGLLRAVLNEAPLGGSVTASRAYADGICEWLLDDQRGGINA
jgi:hypothetical protein